MCCKCHQSDLNSGDDEATARLKDEAQGKVCMNTGVCYIIVHAVNATNEGSD